MRIVIETPKTTYRRGEDVVVRVIVTNDSFEAVRFDQRLLVGPNPSPERFTGIPFGASVEGPAAVPSDNVKYLNPFCLYGRERSWSNLPLGRTTLRAYVLRGVDDPTPVTPDPDAVALVATPLDIEIVP